MLPSFSFRHKFRHVTKIMRGIDNNRLGKRHRTAEYVVHVVHPRNLEMKSKYEYELIFTSYRDETFSSLQRSSWKIYFKLRVIR